MISATQYLRTTVTFTPAEHRCPNTLLNDRGFPGAGLDNAMGETRGWDLNLWPLDHESDSGRPSNDISVPAKLKWNENKIQIKTVLVKPSRTWNETHKKRWNSRETFLAVSFQFYFNCEGAIGSSNTRLLRCFGRRNRGEKADEISTIGAHLRRNYIRREAKKEVQWRPSLVSASSGNRTQPADSVTKGDCHPFEECYTSATYRSQWSSGSSDGQLTMTITK